MSRNPTIHSRLYGTGTAEQIRLLQQQHRQRIDEEYQAMLERQQERKYQLAWQFVTRVSIILDGKGHFRTIDGTPLFDLESVVRAALENRLLIKEQTQ